MFFLPLLTWSAASCASFSGMADKTLSPLNVALFSGLAQVSPERATSESAAKQKRNPDMIFFLAGEPRVSENGT